MPTSDYVASIRSRIGTDYLLLPAVTAVMRAGGRFLLARDARGERWSLIGGGVEPGEQPSDAVAREVFEETGARIRLTRIIGAYGGDALTATYPNGDEVGYVTVAYECELVGTATADRDEIVELGWFTREEIASLDRLEWIDRVIDDACEAASPDDAVEPNGRFGSGRPEIVCICGSMRFIDHIRAAHRDLTFAGAIVLAPGEADRTVAEEQKPALDALHLRKIDLADRILVVNPGGYVGESTSREIAYARAAGKPVSFTDLVRPALS